MQFDQSPASLRTIRSMWFAFLAAPVVYVVVAAVAAQNIEPRPFPQPLTAILVMAALSSVVAGNAVSGRMLAAMQKPGVALDPQLTEDQLAAYQTAMIVRWACFEAASVMGLVLVFLSGQLLAVVIGSGVSLALIASSRPDPKRR